MKRELKVSLSVIALLLISIFMFSTSVSAKTIDPKDYFCKDGTFIRPYYRTSPDSSVYNNGSTIGNINPDTGTTTQNTSTQLVEITTDIVKISTKPAGSYFTLGSTADDVKKIMGDPDYILSNSKCYTYESSIIYFDNDWKVSSWSNFENNLPVYLGEKDSNAKAFTIGSSVKDVIKANGTPDTISNSTSLKYFSYGYATVYFDEDWKVTNWFDFSNILKAKY